MGVSASSASKNAKVALSSKSYRACGGSVACCSTGLLSVSIAMGSQRRRLSGPRDAELAQEARARPAEIEHVRAEVERESLLDLRPRAASHRIGAIEECDASTALGAQRRRGQSRQSAAHDDDVPRACRFVTHCRLLWGALPACAHFDAGRFLAHRWLAPSVRASPSTRASAAKGYA
jgi:hypothetical protein